MRPRASAAPQLSFRHQAAAPADASAASKDEMSSSPPSSSFQFSPYLAQVEFMAAADWSAEVQALCSIISADADGKLVEPDSGTEAHEAWCKIKSVFGKVGTRDELLADHSLDGAGGAVGSSSCVLLC